MSLIVSINGADFEPYHKTHVYPPLVSRPQASQGPHPIDKDSDHGGAFESSLKSAKQKKIDTYIQSQEDKKISRIAVVAKDLMTSPVETLADDEKIAKAKELIKKRGFRHIPIVSANKIVGIISDRTILLANSESPIKDIMITNVIAAQIDTPLQEIAKAMVTHKINSIPVLDTEFKVIGIVTSSDIMESVFKNPNVDLWV